MAIIFYDDGEKVSKKIGKILHNNQEGYLVLEIRNDIIRIPVHRIIRIEGGDPNV